jgi:hypothetical protein
MVMATLASHELRKVLFLFLSIPGLIKYTQATGQTLKIKTSSFLSRFWAKLIINLAKIMLNCPGTAHSYGLLVF